MKGIARPACQDALLAGLLALALAAAWAWRDWANLSALRLPDPDDMMRLQQIRDWLGGQAFGDLAQHRLGADGVPMHWSRLPDLVPAAIIVALEGVTGRHGAEVTAVIAWPALLLAAAIALVGRIARVAGGVEVARPAMIVAAIAYPASTLFLPGRIDHHGLQVVLALMATLALVGEGSLAAGAVAGIAAALSLVVGMETAPLLAMVGAVVVVDWVVGGAGARARLAGFGGALSATTIVAGVVFRPFAWDHAACDGFTAVSMRAMLIAALAPVALTLVGRRAAWRTRAVGATGVATTIGATVAVFAPQCLSPYGGVDPLLRTLWLSRVGEALPLFAAPAATAIGYAGLTLAGIAAGAWQAWRTRSRAWLVLLALQLTAAAVTAAQVRGAYLGAMLAAPALGALIVAARRRGALPLAGAWFASAGMLYPIAAQAAVPAAAPTADGASCTAPDLIAALAALPTGTVMAPIDTGGVALPATRHRLIAAAYHRDGAGDLAMYAFYRGSSAEAQHVAARWRVDYVVACDGFAGVAAPFANRLARGASPPWLRHLVQVTSGARIFATVAGPRARP